MARWFDGVDDYISFGPAPNLDLSSATDEITIIAWVKTTDTDGPIVSFRHSTNDNPVIDFVIGFNGYGNANIGTGKPSVLVRDNNGGGLTYMIGPNPINDGLWHYVAFTRNSSKQSILYVDGIAVAQMTDTMTAPVTCDLKAIGSERRWVLINHGKPNQRYFSGVISEVRIYKRALTADEIRAYMYRRIFAISSLGLYFPLWERSDSTVLDHSGNNNNGTVYGATYADDPPMLGGSMVTP